MVFTKFQVPIFSAVQELLMESIFGFINRLTKIVMRLDAALESSVVDERKSSGWTAKLFVMSGDAFWTYRLSTQDLRLIVLLSKE